MPVQPDALTIHGVAHANTESIEGESIGWMPLGEGAYLHDDNATEVLVVAGRRGMRCCWWGDAAHGIV